MESTFLGSIAHHALPPKTVPKQIPPSIYKSSHHTQSTSNSTHLTSIFATNREFFVIVNCDKNIGPSLIETLCYAKTSLQEHLCTATYTKLTSWEASNFQMELRQTVKTWIKDNNFFNQAKT